MSDCTAQRQVALGEGSVRQSPETQGMRSHRSTQGTTNHCNPLSPPISSAPKGTEKTRPSPALPALLPKCQLGRLSPGTPRATTGRAEGDDPHHHGAVLLGGKSTETAQKLGGSPFIAAAPSCSPPGWSREESSPPSSCCLSLSLSSLHLH